MINTVSIKAHHSIDIIKRHNNSLRRVYTIIIIEIFKIEFELALQMTFKIINNLTGFNELVFILLIFDVYSQINDMNALLPIIIQRIIKMRKMRQKIKEVRKSIAFR